MVPVSLLMVSLLLAQEPVDRAYRGPSEGVHGSLDDARVPQRSTSTKATPTEAVDAQPTITAATARRKVKDGVVVLTPPKHRRNREPPPADRSEGGKLRGGLEFALGSVTAIATGLLIGRGVWELTGGADRGLACDPDSFDGDCAGGLSRGAQIAGGLSLALSLPMAVASGFLFARGAKIHRDYLEWKRESKRTGSARAQPPGLQMTWSRDAWSVGMRWRF